MACTAFPFIVSPCITDEWDLYASFVNLDHRTDRRNHMEQQLQSAGISAVREPGIKPDHELCRPSKFDVMRNRTPGAIGCYLAQCKIMTKAMELGKDALVMEDDLHFCSDLFNRLRYIKLFCDSNEWDIIWLGASFHVPAFWHRTGKSGMPPNCSANLGYDCEPTGHPRMIRTYGAFATFAYIVNKNSIGKVLTMLDADVHTSIGIDFSMIRMQPKLKCFSFVPGCVKQIDNKSDIGNGHTIWSGFLKLNGTYENSAYVYQDKMDDFNPDTFQWK